MRELGSGFRSGSSSEGIIRSMTPPYLPAGPAHDADPAHVIDFFSAFFAVTSSSAFFTNFASHLGPQNRPKSHPGPKKCVRKRRRMRFLSFFLAGVVRSRSPDRFLEGPTLQNRVPTTSRSTILTKSTFSKKYRKSSLRAPVLGPKMAENRCRGHPKSQNTAKNMFF